MSDSPRVIRHRRIKCFGVGESDLEAMLPDLIRRGREPQVGITVSGATITLRITAAGASADDCIAAMEPTVATIHECLGTIVYGEEDDELQDAVVRLLADRKETLATAEWGSGGLIANWLSEAADRLPTAASCYAGGFVVGSVAAREALLQGSTESSATAAEVGQLAVVCRERLGVNFALATGPTPPQSASESAPDFRYALATESGVQTRSSPYIGPPDILKIRAAKQVLNLLRLELLREMRNEESRVSP